MQIETKFGVGSRVWVFDCNAHQEGYVKGIFIQVFENTKITYLVEYLDGKLEVRDEVELELYDIADLDEE